MSATPISFAALRPLVLEEWPQLNVSALDATGGEIDKIVNLVSEATEKPKVIIRRQLTDLQDFAKEGKRETAVERLEGALHRLEGRANNLVDHVKKDLVPEAENKLKENLLTSLLVALGFGLLLGLLLGGSVGRGR